VRPAAIIMNTNALPHRTRPTLAGLACLAAIAVLAFPRPAQAQPDPNDQSELGVIYRKGKTAYDLGNFEEAIKYFKQAYALQPHEAHLYNIAQAYRQAGDCRNALFFYKRYVSVGGEKARHYEVVQRRIKELTSSCKVIDDMKNQPPLDSLDPARGENAGGDGTGPGTGSRGAGTTTKSGQSGAAGGSVLDAEREPSILAASLELGPALLELGGLEFSGAQLSGGIGVGYPLRFGNVGVTLGGLVTYTRVPWVNERPAVDVEGVSHFVSLLANVGTRYWMLDKLAVRLELGAGVFLLSGLGPDNVFIPDGTMATSALGMFQARASVGAEYSLTENLVLTISPFIVSYSPPDEGLRAEIDKFVRFDFTVGFGYQL
jgi:tetratricopeptide (TPR) repeat protein